MLQLVITGLMFLKLGILFGYFLQYSLLLIGFSKIVFGQVALEVATIPSLFIEVLDQIMYSSGEIFIFWEVWVVL